MDKEIARHAAGELVLRTSLKEIACRPRVCKGPRCSELEELGWQDYCDPCRAAFFLHELFPPM